MKKKKKKLTAILKKIFKPLLIVGSIIAGVVASIFAIKKVVKANIGRVGIKKNWEAVPGRNDQVYMTSYNGERIIVQLPKDRFTDEQLTTKNIENIGLAYNIGKEIRIEVKHEKKNRRLDFSGSID